ncbi:hypothetical protein ACERK3_15450 [Phycisphaerales bacterium AB-hyl4]|uniref:Uncharacterized protein n=1 Tax=Natronomicrosphaera hydrolytica TaxID=3242702 RepID=A0ABV4U7W8_9BACT
MSRQPATDTASIQNKIGDALRKAIEPLLEQPATVFDDQIKSLEELLAKSDQLPKSSLQSVKDGLRSLEEAREQANQDYLGQVRSNIATAVLSAVRAVDPKVPLAIRQTQQQPLPAIPEKKPVRKQRMSRAQSEQYADQVEKALPTTKSGNWVSRSEIVEKSGVPEEAIQSILLKLQRSGRAESNGQRGSAGGWRRTE